MRRRPQRAAPGDASEQLFKMAQSFAPIHLVSAAPLLRPVRRELIHQAVNVANQDFAGAVCALYGLAARRENRTAGLLPLIDSGIDVPHDHDKCGRTRVRGGRCSLRTRNVGVFD